MQLIKTDKEFLVVFRALFSCLKARLGKGEHVIFPPGKVSIPKDGEIKTEKNFFFTPEVKTGINNKEVLRQLGVTLYHLQSGKSEHNRESYILDGYQRSLESALWPVISLLLSADIEDPAVIEDMINSPELIEDVKNGKVNTGQAGSGKKPEAQALLEGIASELPVFMPDQVAAKWGMTIPENASLRYSEETLRECIEANRQREDWRLVYVLGLSLREQREKHGTDTNNQPCFYSDNTWWLESKDDSWAKYKPEPGYYLVNFKGQFGDQNWQNQENGITALGERFERCHETVFAESIQSIFMLNNERIAENWWHWGLSLDSDRDRVRVGLFDSHGLDVGYDSPAYSRSILRVCVARKFDF